jgi:hypothetical protein
MQHDIHNESKHILHKTTGMSAFHTQIHDRQQETSH